MNAAADSFVACCGECRRPYDRFIELPCVRITHVETLPVPDMVTAPNMSGGSQTIFPENGRVEQELERAGVPPEMVQELRVQMCHGEPHRRYTFTRNITSDDGTTRPMVCRRVIWLVTNERGYHYSVRHDITEEIQAALASAGYKLLLHTLSHNVPLAPRTVMEVCDLKPVTKDRECGVFHLAAASGPGREAIYISFDKIDWQDNSHGTVYVKLNVSAEWAGHYPAFSPVLKVLKLSFTLERSSSSSSSNSSGAATH
jgi:hypothetical protein